MKLFLKNTLPFFLMILFFNTSFAQDMNSVEDEKDLPMHVLSVQVDSYEVPYMTAFEWIVDKELWFDPMDYSFYIVTDTRLESDLNSFSNKTYKLSNVDRPPFYSDQCLKAEDSWECSKEKIAETIKANIEYPDVALTKNHDGKEVVTFTINEYGKMEGTYKVMSKDKPCKECAQAAVDAVASLRNWYPVMKDGKFVKTEISIPVVFNIEDK